MFSPLDADAVLEELGSKFPLALVRAVDSARADLRALRAWKPDWLVGLFQREVAGVIHARIWTYLTAELDGIDGITFRTDEPHREIAVSAAMGRTFRLRVKRHSDGDQISSYPTSSDLAFWDGKADASFEGLEEIHLAAGYRWDPTTADIGAPVISYREGKSNVIWAVEVDAGHGDAAVPMSYVPIPPSLPQVDFAASERDGESDTR